MTGDGAARRGGNVCGAFAGPDKYVSGAFVGFCEYVSGAPRAADIIGAGADTPSGASLVFAFWATTAQTSASDASVIAAHLPCRCIVFDNASPSLRSIQRTPSPATTPQNATSADQATA